MSKKEWKCLFGDEYGVCPVIPKLSELVQETIQAMKGLEFGEKESTKEMTKAMMSAMASTFAAPIISLSYYCRACPRVPKSISLLDLKVLYKFIGIELGYLERPGIEKIQT